MIPEIIVGFRKVCEGGCYHWASGAELQVCGLQLWTALGHTWPGPVFVHSLTFLLLFVSLLQTSISVNSINSVFCNIRCEGLFK